MMRIFFPILALLLISCQSTPLRGPADINRKNSQRGKASDEIAVYLPGQQVKYVQAPVKGFSIQTITSPDLAKLVSFLQTHRVLFEVRDSTVLQLKIISVNNRDTRTFVRLQQVIERQVNGKKYIIPVESSSLLATINGRRLESLNSNLKNPPSINLIFEHPGFNTQGFSEKQMETLVNYIRNSPDQKKIRDYLQNIANNSQIGFFDFDKFLQSTPKEQLTAMRLFLLSIKRISTAKILIELAQQQKLGLVEHGGEWLFQVTEFMGLPVQFDIAIPKSNETSSRLRVKNLRDLYRKVEIEVYSQPSFPGGGKQLRVSWNEKAAQPTTAPEAQPSDTDSARLFYDVVKYFRKTYNWIGFDGKNDETKVTIIKDIQTPPWAENAFWYKQGNLLGIGADGFSLSNLHLSTSTLAHEYTHAVIDNSSQLSYVNQSGALNEHFADIQGVGAEAYSSGKPFDFTLGEDILTAETADPQKDVIAEVLATLQIPQEEVDKYSLSEPALRNLYLPRVSVFQQLATMTEVEKKYGTDCQPSVDNDNCGVHYSAGVPSRAASIVIGTLGFENTRKMFFNTMAFRLAANDGFQEYVRQLHEECLITSTLNADRDCPLILSSFEKVGITYPLKDNNSPLLTPGLGPIPLPISQIPAIYCGRVTNAKMNNLMIVDNKYDAFIILDGNSKSYTGHFTRMPPQDMATLKKSQCACLKGTIAQIKDSKGTWLNYFSQILPKTIAAQSESVCSGIEIQ